MCKVEFIYIDKVNSERLPKDSFFALKLSKSDKKKLHPTWNEDQLLQSVLCPQVDDYEPNKVFVQGLGWKKFGKTNKVIVPTFSGKLDDWDEYLNQYGRECLFYSLCGCSLYDMDCSTYNAKKEFNSIMLLNDIKKYQKYVKSFKRIHEIQTDVLTEKFSYLPDWERNKLIKDSLFRPCYSFISLFPTQPYLETLDDDAILESIYRKYRHHEIEQQHSDYKRFCELKEMMHSGNNYLLYKDEYDALYHRITNVVIDTLSKEIESGIFPITMSERIKFIFGDECEKLYSGILEDFK